MNFKTVSKQNIFWLNIEVKCFKQGKILLGKILEITRPGFLFDMTNICFKILRSPKKLFYFISEMY